MFMTDVRHQLAESAGRRSGPIFESSFMHQACSSDLVAEIEIFYVRGGAVRPGPPSLPFPFLLHLVAFVTLY